MKKLSQLFFSISMSWPKVIIFACMAGIYTGIVNLIPVFQNTSFSSIAVHFECWIIFALFIILNCKKPLEAVGKTFVFFLISQPLVYLVETPVLGFSVFSYYKKWFIWTLLTIPMSYIAWYIKKKNTISAIILSFATGLLALEAVQFVFEMLTSFPHYLLAFLFCLFWIIILPLITFKTKKNRIITYVITILIGCGIFFYSRFSSENNVSVSAAYEVTDQTDWSYQIDDEHFQLEDYGDYVEITVTGSENLETYMHCTDQDGNEKLVKIIYQDGTLTFEEE